jgi:hypothetical protein
MTTLKQHEQFSHTTRSFNQKIPVDDNLRSKINEIIEVNKDKFRIIKLIDDKEMIEKIFQISDIPNQADMGILYIPRKNSQLLAPLLIMLSTNYDEQYASYIVGKTYGQIGMAAVKAGYHTSFCICYDRTDAQKIIFENDPSNSYHLLANSVFMGIGKIARGTIPQFDVRQSLRIPSVTKAHRDYITIIE